MNIETLIEIFMCFHGSKIVGDSMSGYTFEALGRKYQSVGYTFGEELSRALKHFATIAEVAPDGQDQNGDDPYGAQNWKQS